MTKFNSVRLSTLRFSTLITKLGTEMTYNRIALLERMPILESAIAEELLKGTGAGPSEPAKNEGASAGVNLLGDDLAGLSMGGAPGGNDVYNTMLGGVKTGQSENIMDLLGGLSMGSNEPTMAPTSSAGKTAAVDLLGDLFGNAPSQPTQVSTLSPSKVSPSAAFDPLADLMGSMKPAVPAPSAQALTCYNKNGLLITLSPAKESPQVSQILVSFSTTFSSFTNISFQVAVPKVIHSNKVSQTYNATSFLQLYQPNCPSTAKDDY